MLARIKRSRGFTLMELMVVILILGILIGVLVVAVIPRIGSASRDLDVLQLTKFKQEIDLAISQQKNKRRLGDIQNEGGTSAQFFATLFDKDIITFETVKMLSGASGTKAEEKSYKDVSAPDTSKGGVFIFTGPTSGPDLKNYAGASKKEGVFMSYNKNNLVLSEKEIVLFICGESEARLVAYKDIKDIFSEHGQVPEITFEKPDFFGTYPFAHVAPQ